jgi:hypothetical protein
MDEKGFAIGKTICPRRVFSKASLAQKERIAVV